MKVSEIIRALYQLKENDPEVFIAFRQSSYVYGKYGYGSYEGKISSITFDGKDCIIRLCADMVERVG